MNKYLCNICYEVISDDTIQEHSKIHRIARFKDLRLLENKFINKKGEE